VKRKFFTRKKCDHRDKNARDNLKKIQLVKDPEFSFFIVIKSNAITDIPNPFQELGDLVFGSLK
jgi:hypothetical protein